MINRRRLLLTLSAFSINLRAFGMQFSTHFPHRRRPAPPTHIFPVYIGVDTKNGKGKGHLSLELRCRDRPALFAHARRRDGQSFLLRALAPPATGASCSPRTRPRTAPRASLPLPSIPRPARRPACSTRSAKYRPGSRGPATSRVDSTGHAVFAADYAGSGIASFRVLPSGMLSEPAERINYKDAKFGTQGPDHDRQDAPHPHCAIISPDDRFLVVCDLGNDHLSDLFDRSRYCSPHHLRAPSLLEQPPRLGPPPPRLSSQRPLGLRHQRARLHHRSLPLDDHPLPGGPAGTPRRSLATPVKTIADGFPEANNTAAEIAISPNGYFIYASNRGEDSLVVFAVDQNSGQAEAHPAHLLWRTQAAAFHSGRHGQLAPLRKSGVRLHHHLQRDSTTGQLSGPVQTLPVDAPFFTLFA